MLEVEAALPDEGTGHTYHPIQKDGECGSAADSKPEKMCRMVGDTSTYQSFKKTAATIQYINA
jgi:hypothetical protein